MPLISRHYGLPKSLEFLDVDIANDNRMFLDPHAIRIERGPSPYAGQARKCLTSFFDEIVDCVLSPKKADKRRGLDLLQHFNEPKETRLGLSRRGIDGHGGDDDVGSWIWTALSTEALALIEVGVLKRVEHLPLFVEGIDKDITSDVTTRIVFEPLAKFTQEMVKKYPHFTSGRHKTAVVPRQVWSVRQHKWVKKNLELPIAAERPVLLVPKHWAQPRLLMFAGRYYDTSLLSFVQERVGAVNPRTGKFETDSKEVLKRKRKYKKRGRQTIIRVTEEARELDENLVDRFRVFVDEKYEPLGDDKIRKHLKPKKRRARKRST